MDFTTLRLPSILAALLTTVMFLFFSKFYSFAYIRHRIRLYERTDLPGAADEATRLRALLNHSSPCDWRQVFFWWGDVVKRVVALSYRIAWGIGGRANLVWELVVKRRREERTWPKESVDVENQIVTGGEVVPVRRC